MKAKEFIETHKTQFSEYCPCIITAAGDVIECADGHTKALEELFHTECPGEELPQDVMPMQYLIVRTKTVVVDYENQVYSEALTGEQKEALRVLADAGMITIHLGDIHGKY